MPTYRICATPRGSLRVRIADTFVSRGLGLLVGSPIERDEGLLIAPCSSIHTVGMRYAIDVVFMDRGANVLRVCEEVRAGRLRFGWGARAVLELRAGVAAQHGIVPGVPLPELAATL